MIKKSMRSLPRKCRINNRRDFKVILSHGVQLRDRFFFLYSLENKMDMARLGMIVSKKKSQAQSSAITLRD